MFEGLQWSILCYCSPKTHFMNDTDFVRLASMLVLPICLERSSEPIKDAVDIAERLLKECQKRENL